MKTRLQIILNEDLQRLDEGNEYQIVASNGTSASAVPIIAHRREFLDFAVQLMDFPIDRNSKLRIEWGKREPGWAMYLLFEVFCYEPKGDSAIRIIMETRFIAPYYHQDEFFITCHPADLNRLGQMLRQWIDAGTGDFDWSPGQ